MIKQVPLYNNFCHCFQYLVLYLTNPNHLEKWNPMGINVIGMIFSYIKDQDEFDALQDMFWGLKKEKDLIMTNFNCINCLDFTVTVYAVNWCYLSNGLLYSV